MKPFELHFHVLKFLPGVQKLLTLLLSENRERGKGVKMSEDAELKGGKAGGCEKTRVSLQKKEKAVAMHHKC